MATSDKITSRDVARRAGVSQSTVSAVINQSRYVRPDVVERVLQAIAELGYQPNQAARTLKTGRSGVIGLIVPNIMSPYWSAFVRSVRRAASERALGLIVSESDETNEQERDSLRLLVDRQIDGLLLVARTQANRGLVAEVAARLPVVLVDSQLEGLPIDSVTIDTVVGARSGTAHLLEHGRRLIALLNLPSERYGAASILTGYREALAQFGVPFRSSLVRHGGYSEQDGYLATRDLLEQDPAPDAIFVGNHLMTIGALHALTESGLRLPEQVALVGFDDTPWAGWTMPPLSLVDNPRDELGVRALQLLIQRIAHPTQASHTQVLQTRLVLRRSCGCPYVPPHQAQRGGFNTEPDGSRFAQEKG